MRHLGLKKRYMEVLLFFRWGIASLLYPRKLIQPLVVLFYPVIFETIQELLNHKKNLLFFFAPFVPPSPPSFPRQFFNQIFTEESRRPRKSARENATMDPHSFHSSYNAETVQLLQPVQLATLLERCLANIIKNTTESYFALMLV